MPKAAAFARAATSSCSRGAATRTRARRSASSSPNIASTICCSPTPSRPSRSWMASRWAAASAFRCRATSASRRRTRALRCPKPASACFPTLAAAGICRACPAGSAQFMALTGARLDGAECHYLGSRHALSSSSPALADLIERIVTAPTRAQGRARRCFGAGARSEDRAEPPADRQAVRFRSARRHLAALEADDSDWAQSELATLQHQEPAVLQGVAAAARRRRDACDLRRRNARRICARRARRPHARFPRRRARAADRQDRRTAMGSGDARGA